MLKLWLTLFGTIWLLLAAQANARPNCQVVMDAGSSGTRIFLYEQHLGQWHTFIGPHTVALADPVRQQRGKTTADIASTAQVIATSLTRFRHDGPAKADGTPRWHGLDWQSACRLQAVSVYATAGMRLAEQQHPQAAAALWQAITSAIRQKVGPGVAIQARTLSGFEEGLYAWLAVSYRQQRQDLGIVEMGGASSQVAFPCPACNTSDDALRTVRIGGQPVPFYSYSFLGLGQDEAPKRLGLPASCQYDAAHHQPDWHLALCQDLIRLRRGNSIIDPANYHDGHYAGARQVPVARAAVKQWYLTGAFKYLKADQVQRCCQHQGQCYNQQTACYRAAYLPKYLSVLGIPDTAKVADASWTLGAAICQQDHCLAAAKPLRCRWSKNGCIARP